jgi:hypothetical protein
MDRNLMKGFKIELDLKCKGRIDSEIGSCYGKITMGDFSENFYMSTSIWTLSKYKEQWSLALNMLDKKEDVCFIVNVQETSLIEMWCIYFRDEFAYIQNYLIVDQYYNELLGDTTLTPENSFKFIPKRETITEDSLPISEWRLPIE